MRATVDMVTHGRLPRVGSDETSVARAGRANGGIEGVARTKQSCFGVAKQPFVRIVDEKVAVRPTLELSFRRLRALGRRAPRPRPPRAPPRTGRPGAPWPTPRRTRRATCPHRSAR